MSRRGQHAISRLAQSTGSSPFPGLPSPPSSFSDHARLALEPWLNCCLWMDDLPRSRRRSKQRGCIWSSRRPLRV